MEISIWLKWAFMIVSSGMLGASVLMLWKGTLPPPMTNVKVPAVLSTFVLIVGMTGLLVFGDQDLLQKTLAVLSGQ